MSYQFITTEIQDDHIGWIRIDRPEFLNALSGGVLGEIADYIDKASRDNQIRCLVLTGHSKAFAAGADIHEMVEQDHMDVYKKDYLAQEMDQISQCRKPLIAAVTGYALGGGCELAMACDFILAAENAKFGQPEIKLGTLPGMGGSQRLTRMIGRAKAMEMILTGRMITAEEAERAGLVARILPQDDFEEETRKIAAEITEKSLPALMMAKEAVRAAEEMPLQEGLRFERRLFHSSFSTYDKNEGMRAFLEKRPPIFKDR